TGKTTRHGPVSATPSASSSSGTPPPPPSGSSGTTYGDPSGVALREIERDASHVVLELLTPGFTATPAEGGPVSLSIPGFFSTSEPGEPSLPMRRAWLDAAAGRKVKLASVSATDVVHYGGLRPTSEATREIEVGAEGEVVASLGRTEEGAAFSSTFPTSWARLVRAVFQGETKKAEVIFSPLRWDGTGLELSRRLVVRLDFGGTERGETSRGGSRGRRAVARGSHVRSGVIAQLAVKDRRLHRVDYTDIF